VTDIMELLRQPYTDRDDIMRSWDALRIYLLDGRTGSYARDIFEIILSNIDEEREQAADEIDRLRSALSTAEEEIERLTEKAIVGEYMWTPEELDEAVAAARKEAIEEAARYHDDLSDQHEASAIDTDSKAQGHHAKQMIAHVRHAAAIRAIAEKTGGKP
jgi:chromosome segregation ATPase